MLVQRAHSCQSKRNQEMASKMAANANDLSDAVLHTHFAVVVDVTMHYGNMHFMVLVVAPELKTG